MRFITLDESGELKLVDYEPNVYPEYAILSHRWGWSNTEVTYDDVLKGVGKDKPGYSKLKFCVEQAARDGLRLSWVDTCCINKADFTELNEAINSMFRWYSKATRCYVYLSDVPNPNDQLSTAESAFPKSNWFTRGWTLQELVAPASVQFFSSKGDLLGDKKSREVEIHQITGIPVEALQGQPLDQFSVEERLTWAARRTTTLPEDAAYCLLGIFDVYVPLIYGEGQENAYKRLQTEVDKLGNLMSPETRDAPWIVPFPRNPLFTGRESLLAELEEKLFVPDQTPKIAITGLGGDG